MKYDGKKLKAIVNSQGRYSNWLADQIGVSRSLVSKMMANERRIRPEHAIAIAKVLGVSEKDFAVSESVSDSKELVTR